MGFKVSFVQNLQSALPAVVDYLNTAPEGRDLFDVDHIIVPNAGVRAWLLQNIASRVGVSEGGTDGVAANVSVKYLGAIDSFMGRGSAQDDAWAVGPLSLSVLSVLSRESGSFDAPIARMGGGLKAARLMADRFDKYNARRPGMIVQWEQGNCVLSPEVGVDGVVTLPALAAQDAWQFDLWQLVRKEIGVEPWPVVVEDLLAHPEKIDVAKLPSKLMVMGLQSLGVRHIRALQLLSKHVDVHVLLVHPSPALHQTWSQVAGKLSITPGVAPLQVRQKEVDSEIDQLVGMWLRGAHDAQMLLASQGIDVSTLEGNEPGGVNGSLLSAVQRSVFSGVAVKVEEWKSEPSFVIHRAHNLSRQVEILFDELLDAFATIPGLQPHDVVIMCADIEKAAPLLEATFRKTVSSADGKTSVQLPFIVADRGLRHVDEGASLLSRLLSVVTGRFSIEDIMSVATSELVMNKVGATSDTISSWQNLIERTGVRWGASIQHRSHIGVSAPVKAHTWLNGIQRSLVGALLPDAVPDNDFGDTVPLQFLDAADIDSVSRLSRVISVLADFENLIHELPEQTVIAWADALQQLLELIAVNNKGQLDDAFEALNTMREYVQAAQGVDVSALKVTFQHFAEQLDEQLSSAPGRQPLRTGAITATSVIPLRDVPFKVVCLLGFDEGTMTVGESEGDDLVSRQEFIGDANPRIDQRRGILDAVCAASDRFILTCNGRSIKNNEEVPLITPLAELVDLCVRIGVTEARNKGYADIEYLHPRHFSSPRNFVEGAIVPGKVWSHDAHVLHAVSATDAQTELATKALEFEHEAAQEIARQDSFVSVQPRILERWLRNPLSAFVSTTLKINTWVDSDIEEPAILPLDLSKNEMEILMNDSMIARNAGIDAVHWANINMEVGNFPVGNYGTDEVDLIENQTDNLFSVASDWGVKLDSLLSWPISIEFDGGEVVGSVATYWAEKKRIAVVDVNPNANNRASRTRDVLALNLLLLRACDYDIEGGVFLRWTTSTAGGAKSQVIGAQYVMLDPAITPEVAIQKIRSLCMLYKQATHAPYPMFGDTAEKFNEGDVPEALKKFRSYVGMDNTSAEGKKYTFVTTNECLVYGVLPNFEDIFEAGNDVDNYFSAFFSTVPAADADLKKDLNIKQTKPPHGGTSVTSYVYA